MASLTIRNLDETAKQRLRERAARHGRSMEEEMRFILAGLDANPSRGGGSEPEALPAPQPNAKALPANAFC